MNLCLVVSIVEHYESRFILISKKVHFLEVFTFKINERENASFEKGFSF